SGVLCPSAGDAEASVAAGVATRSGLRSGSGGRVSGFAATAGRVVFVFISAVCAGGCDLATATAGAKHANTTRNDKECALKRFISSVGTGLRSCVFGSQDVPLAGEPRR